MCYACIQNDCTNMLWLLLWYSFMIPLWFGVGAGRPRAVIAIYFYIFCTIKFAVVRFFFALHFISFHSFIDFLIIFFLLLFPPFSTISQCTAGYKGLWYWLWTQFASTLWYCRNDATSLFPYWLNNRCNKNGDAAGSWKDTTFHIPRKGKDK